MSRGLDSWMPGVSEEGTCLQFHLRRGRACCNLWRGLGVGWRWWFVAVCVDRLHCHLEVPMQKKNLKKQRTNCYALKKTKQTKKVKEIIVMHSKKKTNKQTKSKTKIKDKKKTMADHTDLHVF